MAWANPSSRLHKARLQMDYVTNLPPSRDSCLLWERIYLTQKWYWPMKPFRRVRPGQVLPASQIDQDTGRQVEKALGRQPLRPVRLMSPKPFLRLDFRCQRGLPITFNHDRILKLWKLACLCHSSFQLLQSSIIEKLGEGKQAQGLDRSKRGYYSNVILIIE
jgi:hypothetical protein